MIVTSKNDITVSGKKSRVESNLKFVYIQGQYHVYMDGNVTVIYTSSKYTDT